MKISVLEIIFDLLISFCFFYLILPFNLNQKNMKKLFFVLAIASCAMFVNTSKAQVVEKGNSLVDVTYGWPNLWSTIFKNAVVNTNSVDIKVSGIGPIGVRYEYLVADKIGVGVVFNYANTTVTYTETVIGTTTQTYDYKFSAPRMRAMAKFAFHYGNSDMFDGYFSVGAGYASLNITYETNNPNYTDDNIILNGIPVAFRLATGGRIFFTDNLGALFEIGLGGGGLLEFGLAAKF